MQNLQNYKSFRHIFAVELGVDMPHCSFFELHQAFTSFSTDFRSDKIQSVCVCTLYTIRINKTLANAFIYFRR